IEVETRLVQSLHEQLARLSSPITSLTDSDHNVPAQRIGQGGDRAKEFDSLVIVGLGQTLLVLESIAFLDLILDQRPDVSGVDLLERLGEEHQSLLPGTRSALGLHPAKTRSAKTLYATYPRPKYNIVKYSYSSDNLLRIGFSSSGRMSSAS